MSSDDIAALQNKAKSEGWTFTVGETSATRAPIEELCGLIVPKNWREGARFTAFPAKADLPPAFDWLSLGGCTPIKNQASCGSCWAFATVATFECAIRIQDGDLVNLSEQWLISCNQETEMPQVAGKGVWGCGGGWWAHDYFTGAKTDPCGGSGAVLTAYCPYGGNGVPCNCPYPHDYGLDSWSYIAGEDIVPDPSAIKQAIREYGPVCVAIYANDAFRAYHGGVFNASEIQEPNHAVALVGWDDDQGASGVWILRNSWSEDWGENGYARIEYGCSNVGYGACYVSYPGKGRGIGPAITSQPKSGTVPERWFHAFSVTATGIGTLHYQWQHDGQDIGGDTPALNIESASDADAGFYRCHVSDVRGVSISAAAELQVDASQPVPVSGVRATAACLAALTAFALRLLRRREHPSANGTQTSVQIDAIE